MSKHELNQKLDFINNWITAALLFYCLYLLINCPDSVSKFGLVLESTFFTKQTKFLFFSTCSPDTMKLPLQTFRCVNNNSRFTFKWRLVTRTNAIIYQKRLMERRLVNQKHRFDSQRFVLTAEIGLFAKDYTPNYQSDGHSWRTVLNHYNLWSVWVTSAVRQLLYKGDCRNVPFLRKTRWSASQTWKHWNGSGVSNVRPSHHLTMVQSVFTTICARQKMFVHHLRHQKNQKSSQWRTALHLQRK